VSAQVLSDALWAALAVAAVALVVTSHLPSARLARLSTLVRRAEANPVAYVIIVLAWMWLGWHDFAR
jgi:hypothetical protein